MSLNKVNYVHGQTIISAQNMNDIQDEVIRLGEKVAIQSDWSQNDETALDFIKNRTHWSNCQESEFFNGLFENNDGIWGFISENTTLPRLDSNEKYQVIIENEVFESNLRLATGEEMDLEGANVVYIFGNHSLVFPDTDNTGEPFTLALIEAVDGNVSVVVGMLALLDDIPRQNEGYSIKISGKVINSIKKLDEIYMPESYDAAKTVLSNLMNQMSEVETEISDHAIDIGHLQLDVLNVLKSTTQTLTEDQKARARKNIGAVGVDEQVQADLSETDESSFAFVKGTLRREHFPMSIPSLSLYHFGANPISVPINDWIGEEGEGAFLAQFTIENSNLLQQICERGIGISFGGDIYYVPLYRLYSIDIAGRTYCDANSTIMVSFHDSCTSGMIMVLSNEKPTFTQINFAHLGIGFGTEGTRELHPALLPDVAVKHYELDNLNLITLEDIDFICAKRVKVTFPVHGLSIKISYTDAKGVFHENENLPEKSKTTYEVLKGTSITLNGNYFDKTSFVLPEDNKYYTKISDSEIIPLMDFEIKYADRAPT